MTCRTRSTPHSTSNHPHLKSSLHASTRPQPGGPDTVPAPRRTAIVALFTLSALAIVGTATAVLTTAATANPTNVFETAPIVEYGLPIFKTLTNISIAAVVGSLMLAAFVLPETSAARREVLDLGAGATIAAMVFVAPSAVLTFLNLAGSVSPEVALASLGQFLTSIAVGQAWTATFVLLSVIAVLCFAVRRRSATVGVFGVAVIALVPLALQGHAAGDGSHTIASTSLWLHIAASSAWMGGLAVLLIVRRRLDPAAVGSAITKFSTAALICFIVVTVAGVTGAALRITEPTQLFTTSYGVILTLKSVILVALGSAGAWYRTRLQPRGDLPSTKFWRVVAVELALMGIAIGLAVVLARTAPPGGEEIAVTPSERLTGLPLPPPLTAPRLFDAWALDPLWLLAAATVAVVCVRAVRRARNAGDSVPWLRVGSTVLALVVFTLATSGWMAVYGTYLLSVRASTLALLTVAVPALFILGGTRATVGRMLGGATRARLARAAGWWAAPLVTGALLAGLVTIWTSPSVLRWSVEDPVGAQLTVLLPLGAGVLFFLTVLRTRRTAIWPSVVGAAIVAGAFVIAASGLMTGTLRSVDWYGVITEGWTTHPLADQHIAGAVLLGAALLVSVAVPIAAIAGHADVSTRSRRRRAGRSNGADDSRRKRETR